MAKTQLRSYGIISKLWLKSFRQSIFRNLKTIFNWSRILVIDPNLKYIYFIKKWVIFAFIDLFVISANSKAKNTC